MSVVGGLTGIASGVDTSGIVDKLMTVERGPRDRMDWTKTRLTTVGTDLGTVQSKMLALRSAAAGLRDIGTWANQQTVESSDPRVVASRISGAGPGGYSINVLGLARAEQHTYTYTPPTAATTIDFGSSHVDLSAGTTIDQAVSTINAAADAPVYAADVGGQLVLSARTTGTTSAFTATSGALSNETIKAGTDATYTVDNGPVQTSHANVVTDAIPGIQLTFKGTTSSPAAVTVGAPGLDHDLIKSKIQAFVAAYNDVVTTTRGFLNEQKVPAPTDAASSAKGVLFGDTGLDAMLNQLRTAASNPVAGMSSTLDELRELGVSTGAPTGGLSTDDSKAGLLTFDPSVLDNALNTDPVGTRRLMGGIAGTDGVAQRFEDIVKTYVGATGQLDSRIAQNGSAVKDLQSQMTAEDNRLTDVQNRLKAQFAAMESAMLQSQTTQSWLTGQIAQLR